MLDEQGFKPLSVLKDDLGFAKLNWFTYFGLKTKFEKIWLPEPWPESNVKRSHIPL